jgi:hypothetical protein
MTGHSLAPAPISITLLMLLPIVLAIAVGIVALIHRWLNRGLRLPGGTIPHSRSLPNVDIPDGRLFMPPPIDVPHVPSVCRSCGVHDHWPTEGKLTRMHPSGLCRDKCYPLTEAARLEAKTRGTA